MQRYLVRHFDYEFWQDMFSIYKGTPITDLSTLIPGQNYRVFKAVTTFEPYPIPRNLLHYYEPFRIRGKSVEQGLMKYLGTDGHRYNFYIIGSLPKNGRFPEKYKNIFLAKQDLYGNYVILPGDSPIVAPTPRETAEVLRTAPEVLQEHGKEKGLEMIQRNLRAAALNRRSNAIKYFMKMNPRYRVEKTALEESEEEEAAGGGGGGGGGRGGGRHRSKIGKSRSRRRNRRTQRKN
jgi:hypothetical protein